MHLIWEPAFWVRSLRKSIVMLYERLPEGENEEVR